MNRTLKTLTFVLLCQVCTVFFYTLSYAIDYQYIKNTVALNFSHPGLEGSYRINLMWISNDHD